jgi:hypothetical protein
MYGPCAEHKGDDGQLVFYAGPNVYEPSKWVLEVVGGRYRAPGDGGAIVTYVCDGYDPRSGFWMRAPGGAQRNVSERAIDRTYHRVREPGE